MLTVKLLREMRAIEHWNAVQCIIRRRYATRGKTQSPTDLWRATLLYVLKTNTVVVVVARVCTFIYTPLLRCGSTVAYLNWLKAKTVARPIESKNYSNQNIPLNIPSAITQNPKLWAARQTSPGMLWFVNRHRSVGWRAPMGQSQ